MPRKSKGRSQEPSERDSLVSRPSTSSNSNMFASVSYATYSVENAVNLSTSIMRGFNDSTFHNNNQQQQRPHGPNRSQPNYFKNIISQNNNQKEKKTPPMAPSRKKKPQIESKLIEMAHSRSTTSNTATMMHILKGNIGTGILAMPSAFKNSGLAVGTIGVPIMGIIAIHCMHILVRCQEVLSTKMLSRHDTSFLDYEDVAEQAFKNGPSFFPKWSSFVRKSVIVFLLITQLGFCCVYSLFVADSLEKIVANVAHVTISPSYFMMIILIPMIILNQVKSLKHLAYASTIANILQTTGLILIFVDLLQGLPPTSSVPASNGFSKLPLFFGTAIYAFEGIGIVLPIKKDMSEPKAFGGLNGVLNTSMTVVACLYTGMGFFGYLKYGDRVQGSITLNLAGSALNEVIRAAFATSIFLSYALQMYVPLGLIWPWITRTFVLEENESKTNMYNIVFRAVMVTFTFLVAAAVPKLDLFISLVGAFSSSCLALIFPPLFDSLTFWDERDLMSPPKRYMWYGKNIFICVFGIMGFMTGTYASIMEIVHYFSQPPAR